MSNKVYSNVSDLKKLVQKSSEFQGDLRVNPWFNIICDVFNVLEENVLEEGTDPIWVEIFETFPNELIEELVENVLNSAGFGFDLLELKQQYEELNPKIHSVEFLRKALEYRDAIYIENSNSLEGAEFIVENGKYTINGKKIKESDLDNAFKKYGYKTQKELDAIELDKSRAM